MAYSIVPAELYANAIPAGEVNGLGRSWFSGYGTTKMRPIVPVPVGNLSRALLRRTTVRLKAGTICFGKAPAIMLLVTIANMHASRMQ